MVVLDCVRPAPAEQEGGRVGQALSEGMLQEALPFAGDPSAPPPPSAFALPFKACFLQILLNFPTIWIPLLLFFPPL